MVDSQRGADLAIYHLISKKREWNNCFIKVSATLKIAIFPYLRFQRFQIGMLESFLLKKNQKKILFLSKDIGGKRFFLVNYRY